MTGGATNIIFEYAFAATEHVFCRDKSMLATNRFVATKLCLLRQKFCRDKHIFVATKIIPVATPANDRFQGGGGLNVCEFHEAETEVCLGSLLQRR